MLSRKQFLKELFRQGLRFCDDLASPSQSCNAASTDSGLQAELPFTEISPSLLAIEAQRRGITVENDGIESLRQDIYREMAGKCPLAVANPTTQKAF